MKTYQILSIREIQNILRIARAESKAQCGKVRLEHCISIHSHIEPGFTSGTGREQVSVVHATVGDQRII